MSRRQIVIVALLVFFVLLWIGAEILARQYEALKVPLRTRQNLEHAAPPP